MFGGEGVSLWIPGVKTRGLRPGFSGIPGRTAGPQRREWPGHINTTVYDRQIDGFVEMGCVLSLRWAPLDAFLAEVVV